MDFWQTVGGHRFQAQLLHQLTRIANGIDAQNSLYEQLLPPDDDQRQLATNCDNCEEDKCQPFIAKAVWLHDDDGNDVMQHCRCTCTCHLEKKEITV